MIETDQFVRAAQAFSDLGGSIQAQFTQILEGDIAECNPNAVAAIRKFLKDYDWLLGDAEDVIGDIDAHQAKRD